MFPLSRIIAAGARTCPDGECVQLHVFSGVCVVVCACIRLCLNTSAFVGVFTSRCGQGAPYGDSEISTRCLEVSFSEKHESLSAVNEF